MQAVVWSFNVMASGKFPGLDHLGRPFESDLRSAHRNFELADGICCALVEMRADLLEFVGALGFTRWDNVENQCFCCMCNRDSLFDFPATVDASRWADRDASVYSGLCEASVKRVTVKNRSQLRRLLKCMRHDREYWGFALWQQFSELGLCSGHRLIPCSKVPDTHRVEEDLNERDFPLD